MNSVWVSPITRCVVCVRSIFGDSPVNLSPAGLPVDMRLDGDNENIGWVADNKDADITAENDKSMRNHGYMKAPKAFTACDGKGETNLRDTKAVLRRIMVSAYIVPEQNPITSASIGT